MRRILTLVAACLFAAGSNAALSQTMSFAAQSAPRALKVGDTWTYQLRETRFNRELATVTYQITASNAASIGESVHLENTTHPAIERRIPGEPRIFEQNFSETIALFEFAPYLTAFAKPEPELEWPSVPGAISDEEHFPWRFEAKVAGKEWVRVPAGYFNAWKIELKGTRNTGRHMNVGRPQGDPVITYQVYTAWFVPGIGRLVKYERKTHNRLYTTLDMEEFELVSYTLK